MVGIPSQAVRGVSGEGEHSSGPKSTDEPSDTTPLSRSARRRQETHQRLITAARDLVAEHGPDGFTVSELAEQADVGVGTVYNHFEDWRHDPILEWVTGPDEICESIGVDELAKSNAAAICHITAFFVREAQADPTTARMLQQLFPTELWPRDAYIDAFAGFIAAGIEAGEFPESDIETLARAVLSLGQSYIRQIAAGSDLELDEATQLVLRLLGVSEITLPD